MHENRLFKIVYYLLDKGKATAQELATEFEVSVRTIYRDIDALSGAGVPVYASQGKGGGIALLDGFVLDKALVSPGEQQLILSALKGLAAITEESSLLRKLGALFRQESSDWIQVDFSRWGDSKEDERKFRLLKAAILNQEMLLLRYCSSNGESAGRTVKPLRICCKASAWYLQAYCMEKCDFRTFKLSRIISVEPTGEYFEDILVPPPLEFVQNEELHPLLILKFSKVAAYRVYDEFEQNAIQIQEDGSIIVKCRMPEDSWLYGYLMSFCGSVEVLSPNSVKDNFLKKVEKMYEEYFKEPEG